MTTTTLDTARFIVPRYTVPEAARYLGVPYGTFSKWVNGYRFTLTDRKHPVRGRPILHAEPASVRGPRLTFGALVEGMVIAALRKAGLPLQSIRRAARALRNELGDEWALASQRLIVSGADVLWNYAEDWEDEESAELVEVVSGQRVFTDTVRQYLERIEYGDGFARRLFLPLTHDRVIGVDPLVNLGQPTFLHGTAPARAVLQRIRAGEPVDQVADDYAVPLKDILAIEEHASALAA